MRLARTPILPSSGAVHPDHHQSRRMRAIAVAIPRGLDAPDLAAAIPGQLGRVEPVGTIELDHPVLAHLVSHPAGADPAVEDMAADLPVIREEMPMVAGDVQPADP